MPLSPRVKETREASQGTVKHALEKRSDGPSLQRALKGAVYTDYTEMKQKRMEREGQLKCTGSLAACSKDFPEQTSTQGSLIGQHIWEPIIGRREPQQRSQGQKGKTGSQDKAGRYRPLGTWSSVHQKLQRFHSEHIGGTWGMDC